MTKRFLLSLIALTMSSAQVVHAAYCDGSEAEPIEFTAGKWSELNRHTRNFYAGFYERTGQQSLSRYSGAAVHQRATSLMNQVKAEINKTLTNSSPTQLAAIIDINVLLERFAVLSTDLMTVTMGAAPYDGLNVTFYQTSFGIEIPTKWIRQNLSIPSNFIVLPRQNGALMAPSRSHILALGIRSQAMSPKATGDIARNYLHITKCMVANESAINFVKNQLVEADGQIPAHDFTSQACRGLSLKQMIDIHLSAESAIAFKKNLLNEVPYLEESLSENQVASIRRIFEAENALARDLGDLAINEDIDSGLRQLVVRASDTAINSDPVFQHLEAALNSNAVRAQISSLQSSCGMSGAGRELLDDIRKAFKVNLLKEFENALNETEFHSVSTSVLKLQLKLLYNKLVFKALVLATEVALAKHLPIEDPSFPRALANELAYRALSRYHLNTTAFDSAATKQIQAVNARASKRHDTTRNNFIDDLLQAATNAKKYMDPRTPLSQLPYDRSAIISFYEAELGRVSNGSSERLSFITRTQDGEQLRRIYSASRESLIAELRNLGGRLQSERGVVGNLTEWARSWVRSGQAQDKQSRIDQINADIRTLDKVAEGLALTGSNQQRRNFADAIADQRLSNGELNKFKRHYRQALLNKLLGEFRILDIQVRINNAEKRQALYLLLSNNNLNQNQKRTLIDNAFAHLGRNQMAHLQRINGAHNLAAMKDYILNSTMIAATMGMYDMQKAILDADLAKMQGNSTSGLTIAGLQVFTHLVRFHTQKLNEWSEQRTLNRYVWDDIFHSSLIFALPFAGGWLAKWTLASIPTRATWRGAGLIHHAYLRSKPQWERYWDFVIMAMVVDAGVVLNRMRANYNDQKRIESMTYTDYSDRALLFAQDYMQRKEYLKEDMKELAIRFGWDVAWIALPLAMNASSTKIVNPLRRRRIAAREDVIGHNTQVRNSVNIKANRTFRNLGTFLQVEFRTLGFRNPNFNLTELHGALGRIKARGNHGETARAQQAYDRIITSTGEKFIPYLNSPQQLRIFGEASVGDLQQVERLFRAYNRIHRPGAA